MTAGTSSTRMMAASMRMAATMPTPATLMKTWSLGISDSFAGRVSDFRT